MGALALIRRTVPGHPGVAGSVLALVLTTAALVELALSATPDRGWAAVVVVLLATLPLAWRDRAPVVVVALPMAAVLVFSAAFGEADELPLMLFLGIGTATYSLGELGSNRQVLIGGAVVVVGFAALGVMEDDAGAVSFGVLTSLALLGVGRAVRIMGFESDVLEARIGRLQEDQERRAREAVTAERARIARELHDVIGHSISVMGVQAGAVRRVLPPELAEERETLQSVERTGRDAVTEMRRLLDLLRSAGEAPSGALPTLTLTPQLIADMRHAGLGVELEIDGELEDVPPGLALAAYRIVQEALTNALKHAPDARVRVAVRRTAGQLEVEVLQEPSERVSAEREGPGHGLVGMHERVALYGGRLAVGPGSDGGFEVRATLPLQAAGA
jgi:signal transduction histidine kinase